MKIQIHTVTQLHKRTNITRRVHFQSLVLLADVDRGQFRLCNWCGVIHQHHHRVNVDVIVILWWGGRSPYLCCKFTRQNAIKKIKITRFTLILMQKLPLRQHFLGEVTYRHDLCVTILSFKDIFLLSGQRINQQRGKTPSNLTRSNGTGHSPCCMHLPLYR